MIRVALYGVRKVVCVKTEKELEILIIVSGERCISFQGVGLTPMLYVWEQYISPRKKSRNSTG